MPCFQILILFLIVSSFFINFNLFSVLLISQFTIVEILLIYFLILPGAHEIRSMLQQDVSSFAEHHTVQTRLDDFYMSRIGIRMVNDVIYYLILCQYTLRCIKLYFILLHLI